MDGRDAIAYVGGCADSDTTQHESALLFRDGPSVTGKRSANSYARGQPRYNVGSGQTARFLFVLFSFSGKEVDVLQI